MSQRRFRVHDGVEDDLADAVAYLLKESPADVDRLVEKFVDRMHFVSRWPLIGPTIYVRYRHHIVKPFRYMIIYSVTEAEIRVHRFVHAMRDPKTIQVEVEGRTFDE